MLKVFIKLYSFSFFLFFSFGLLDYVFKNTILNIGDIVIGQSCRSLIVSLVIFLLARKTFIRKRKEFKYLFFFIFTLISIYLIYLSFFNIRDNTLFFKVANQNGFSLKSNCLSEESYKELYRKKYHIATIACNRERYVFLKELTLCNYSKKMVLENGETVKDNILKLAQTKSKRCLGILKLVEDKK